MNVYSPVGCGIPDRAQNMVHMMNKSNICGLLDCAVWWASPRGKKNPTLVYGPNALREMARNFYLDSENLLYSVIYVASCSGPLFFMIRKR